MSQDRLRRHMLSQDRWETLTENYPGLAEQPLWLARDAKHIVEWESKGKARFAGNHPNNRPSERKAAYADAAKKISQAREAIALAFNLGMAPFDVLPVPDDESGANVQTIADRFDFVQNTLVNMKVLEQGLNYAAQNVKAAKTGPNNLTLEIFVWQICRLFKVNGLQSRISGGEESHSVTVFIKSVFSEFNYRPKDRAIADFVRSYQKNPL